MQQSPDTRAQCQGKQPFPTKDLAGRVAKSSNRKRDRALNVYRCPQCTQFHVGTPSRSKQ